MVDEIWKDIKDFESFYQVSNLGKIRNKRTGLILSGDIGEYGKTRYTLRNRKKIFGHILVAKAFPEICGKWFNGCQVHHKDGNPSNNIASNLICLSIEEHSKIHRKMGKNVGENNPFYGKTHTKETIEKITHKTSKPVTQYSLQGNVIAVWQSCSEAGRVLGFDKTSINRCCQNKQVTAYGFKWEYAN